MNADRCPVRELRSKLKLPLYCGDCGGGVENIGPKCSGGIEGNQFVAANIDPSTTSLKRGVSQHIDTWITSDALFGRRSHQNLLQMIENGVANGELVDMDELMERIRNNSL